MYACVCTPRAQLCRKRTHGEGKKKKAIHPPPIKTMIRAGNQSRRSDCDSFPFAYTVFSPLRIFCVVHLAPAVASLSVVWHSLSCFFSVRSELLVCMYVSPLCADVAA